MTSIIQPGRPIKVAIVGAGLGGLAAAIAISREGHLVTVLEQASTLHEVGAGIQVPPNSSRILARWGILDQIEAVAVKPNDFRLRSYRDGTLLSIQNMILHAKATYGSPYLHIHRADYHTILVREAIRLGVEISLNARATGVDFERPAVFLENQPAFEADLVVGADGLKSRCRETMLGRDDPPYLTGDLAYRIILRVEDMKKVPELQDLIERPNIDYWMGPGCHVVGYMLQGGQAYNVVLICPDNLPEDMHILDADVEEMCLLFKDWDPRLRAMLSLVVETKKWRLRDSREMPTWTHSSGKFVLIGDACHATLPYLAQGAAQAIEDGAALGAILGKITETSQIPDALEKFEMIRKPRTERVVRESRALRDIFHLPNGEGQLARDMDLITKEPFEGYPNRWADPVFQRYLFGYDAYVEALSS
ncbi:FAD/NAD(P)-binding domain-containing protein [Aureobasidium subglaciale]|nr:FAD/NAD(P)-binding domain-containing protein [Aureobasidium subglaciale]